MSFDTGYWLSQYGYAAVLLGTFLEGESILLAGAWAARTGYLDIRGVALAALCGSFMGDQLYFWLGRRFGQPWLDARPQWRKRASRIFWLLDRYQARFILAFRFLYGLRSVAPFVLGASHVPVRRFLPLNFLGALLWSVTVSTLGYALGSAADALWEHLPAMHVRVVVLAAVAPLVLGLWARSKRPRGAATQQASKGV